MITNKIKALLSLKNSGLTKFANFIGKSQPTISNKARRDSWTAVDLIKIAELTDTQLNFADKETGKILISFDSEDINNAD